MRGRSPVQRPGRSVCLVEAGRDYGASALPGAAADDDWGDGWSYEALERCFDRAERMLEVHPLAREELIAWHAAFADAAACALGAVTEADRRLPGFENLHIADTSFIPTVPSVNTNLTVAAIAERISERMSQQ